MRKIKYAEFSAPHLIFLAIVFSGSFIALLGCANMETGRHRSSVVESADDVGRQTMVLGVPWEKDFGYSAAVKTRGMIYVSGQLSFDDKGTIQGTDTETQMRQAYANIEEILKRNGATMKDVVEEVIYVTDMQAALAVAPKVRRNVYAEHAPASDQLQVASTIIQVGRLAFPEALVEIKVTAQVERPKADSSESSNDSNGRRGGGGQRGRGGGFPPF